jgi:hypothetical protein
VIVDSQTATTTLGDGHRGDDAGKALHGRKRHIAVDTLGLVWSLGGRRPCGFDSGSGRGLAGPLEARIEARTAAAVG